MSQKVTKKKKYDPSKNYEWDPNVEFVLTGMEFSELFHLMKKQSTNGQLSVSPLAVVRATNILQEMLERGVEEGIVTEIKEENPPK